MDIKKIKDELEQSLPRYDNLGKNFVQAITLLLEKNRIKFVSVYYRVKEIDSFIEKIERKSYVDPLGEIEDICGIRIICYYQSDIERISKILSEEFNILNSEDKENQLKADQFGYRSVHFIASIKGAWTQVPNYRDLENLKAEIQVRTILMHAWAEIEHNLAYKKETHIPEKFKRKLFRISAKLEEADEQFEDLKMESKAHQEDLLKKAKNKTLKFTNETDINLDTLQAFLDYYFPDRQKNIEHTASLLDEIINNSFKLGDIADAYEKLKPNLDIIENQVFPNNDRNLKWVQVGIVRMIMDIMKDSYNKRHLDKDKRAYNARVAWRKKFFS